jgi:HlyD family secretion protein
MKRRKIIIGLAIVVVLGLLAWANLGLRGPTGISVTVEKIEARDLESIVSASGKIQPKAAVNISAETPGKVVRVAVNEGELVTKGQLLVEIDPKNLETRVQNSEASLGSAKSQLEQLKAQIENAKVALREAQDTLKRNDDLFKNGLLPKDVYERSQNDVQRQATNLQVSEQSYTTQEQRIKQEQANLDNARYDLNKVRLVAPISGLVTRRSIEEGETAVVGTMNNAGTVLLQIADLSVIETEIEVDETDIPFIRVGQPAKVTIDAIPDRTFPGKVTEVGNSPIQAAGAATGRATNFKVVVTIEGQVPNARPGFTCTAVITTATRQKIPSVPIQAMTVREVVVDAEGEVVPRAAPPAPGTGGAKASRPTAQPELQPGQKRQEVEGVFVVKDGHALFVPVKTGIAGEKYFEILKGLSAGDEVITGPFASVRNLREGDLVRVQSAPSLGGRPGAPAPNDGKK